MHKESYQESPCQGSDPLGPVERDLDSVSVFGGQDSEARQSPTSKATEKSVAERIQTIHQDSVTRR